jgi:hypothetical protein
VVAVLNVAEWWPAITVGAVVVTAAGRVVIVCWSLRGTQPEDRPEIIRALAEMFRWWRLR